MLGDDLEADVPEEVGVDDALIDRAVAEYLHRRAQFGRHQPGVGKVSGFGRPSERLQRPDPAADEVPTTAAIRPRGSPPVSSAASMPIEVSRTASALTGPVGNSAARGTARGGA